MTIIGYEKAFEIIVKLEGNLDVKSASDLEKYLQQTIYPLVVIKKVILDFAKLTYVSSMGLRVILQAYKNLTKHRKTLRIIHIPDNIRDIFEMTGFMQLLVQDEKFVVIEKERNPFSIVYALFGDLNVNALSFLDGITQKVKNEGINNVHLICEDLNSISAEGCTKLRDLWDIVKKTKGFLTMENLSDPVLEAMKNLGFEDLIKTAVIKRSETEKEAFAEAHQTERYSFTGPWGSFQLPPFDEAWKQQHEKVKTVEMDLKGVTDITPDAFTVLMELKKNAMEQGIQVDLSL